MNISIYTRINTYPIKIIYQQHFVFKLFFNFKLFSEYLISHKIYSSMHSNQFFFLFFYLNNKIKQNSRSKSILNINRQWRHTPILSHPNTVLTGVSFAADLSTISCVHSNHVYIGSQ